MSEVDPGVLAALSRVRRAEGESEGRRAFTVARTEAVLRMRELPRPGSWHFTLALVRAANAVARGARGFARESSEGETRVVTLTFSTAGLDYATVDLRGLVLAAADGDSDMSEETCDAARRWRRLVGAGVNGALAGAPLAVEVRTSAGAVRYILKESHAVGQDPYVEVRAPGRCPPQAFEVEVRWPRPGFGRRLTRWLSRQASAEAALTELWQSALPGAEPGQTAEKGIELGRPLPGSGNNNGAGKIVSLGAVGTWGAVPELGGPWLVREGVRVVSLAPALTRLGVTPGEVAGWVECGRLRLTADASSVAIDAGFELLAAWLLDARAHSYPQPGGAGFVVQWPTELRHVPTVSGRPVPIELVAQRCRQGRDLVHVWPHRASEVPPAVVARVFALWPSELLVLQAAIPEARLVPARALGESPQFERADLSKLIKSSLAGVSIDLGGEAALTTANGVIVRIAVEAFVHRFASAAEGAIALLCHGRRVAHVRETARTIAGVTLVATLVGETPESLTIDGLRADKGFLTAIAERCREAAMRAIDGLLAPALGHESPWELPLVRAQAAALTGATLGVRYRLRRGSAAPELGWERSPLLGLAIGHDMAGHAVTLEQALIRCREAGGIVVEDPRQRWPTFRSPDPLHEPWVLSREGRGLLERVVGTAVLWDMPTTPEGNLQPGSTEAPRGLEFLRIKAEGLGLLIAGARTERARADLRAHVLVTEALGGTAPEVVDLPLFARYDPRTLDPLRMVSRSDARAEGLSLLPFGSGSRALAGPVLLVTPGEARLLHAAGHPLAAAANTNRAAAKATRAPVRRAGGPRSLVVLPVADALCLGALRVEEHPAKIAVWGGGLHIKDVELKAPLDWIGGRLALTREGTRAGADRLAAQVTGLARETARKALRERLLHPPGSPQRAGLDAFRDRCEAGAAETFFKDGMFEGTGVKEHVFSDMLSGSLKKDPLQGLGSGPRRFEKLLRQALGRPIAVSGAILSWQAGRLVEAKGRAWSIELGRRNAEIQAALAEEAPLGAMFAAGSLVIGQLFAQARAQGLPGSGVSEEQVAGYRALALLYAHVP